MTSSSNSGCSLARTENTYLSRNFKYANKMVKYVTMCINHVIPEKGRRINFVCNSLGQVRLSTSGWPIQQKGSP